MNLDIDARETRRWGQNVEQFGIPIYESNNTHDKYSSFTSKSLHHRRDVPKGEEGGFTRLCTGVVSAPHSLPKSPDDGASGLERGRLARRNVNTGRPISLIGTIRSNARHSPNVYNRCRKAQPAQYVPESRHCSYTGVYAMYIHARMYRSVNACGMLWKTYRQYPFSDISRTF